MNLIDFKSREMVLSEVKVHQLNTSEAVDNIINLTESGKSHIVVTPNLDHLEVLSRDNELRKKYNQATLSLIDGWPVELFLKWSGYKDVKRVAGSDVLPKICNKAFIKRKRLFFLGGSQKALEVLKEKFSNEHSDAKIEVYAPPFGFEKIDSEVKKINDKINSFKPDLLILSLGFPKQEIWAFSNKDNLACGVILCLGASAEFMAGTIKRAPLIYRKINMEWFYRLISEPTRLYKRYLLRDLPFGIKLGIKILFKNRDFNENQ